MIFDHGVDGLKEPVQPLSRLCGNEDQLRVGHEGEGVFDLLRKAVNGLVILLHGVPLVDGDDHSLSPFVGDARDLGILLRHAFHGVDHKDDHIRALHRSHGAHDHVALQLLLDLVLPAQARRIDEDIFLPVMHHLGVDGVPGRSRDIGDDHPVLSQQTVDDGGFPHVGLSHDRHPGPLVLLLRLALFRKMGDHLIQHISQSHPVCRGNGMRIPDPQVVKLIYVRHIFIEAVHLVHHKDDRLVRPAEHVRHLGIGVHQSLLHIHHEQDHIRRINGDLRLLPHLGKDDVGAVRLDASRIDQGEHPVQPGHIRIDPVPGDARRILHDGDPLSRKGIEQRGLSHIRPSHHRNDRFSGLFAHSYLISVIFFL